MDLQKNLHFMKFFNIMFTNFKNNMFSSQDDPKAVKTLNVEKN